MALHEDVPKKISIGRQLRHCPGVLCLGPRTNVSDYAPRELALIRNAPKVYFPTGLLAEPLAALGKPTYPSVQTYRFAADKVRQTRLFQLLELPMPSTRIYFGPQQQVRILDEFSLPLIAKVPRNSAQGLGIYLIRTRDDLQAYLDLGGPAYIQEYLPISRDLRVVILGERIVHAYWRETPPDDYRSNVARGGKVRLGGVPDAALELALNTARTCNFNHVGLDLCEHDGRLFLLEANMSFGLQGFTEAGLDFRAILREMVEKDEV